MYRGFRTVFTLSGYFLGGWIAIRFLLPITAPFVLGLLLALLAEPLARGLRRPLGNGAAAAVSVTVVFFALAVLAAAVCAFALRQLGRLSAVLPDMENAARSGFALAQDKLLELTERTPASLQNVLRRNVTEAFSDGSALLERGVQLVLSFAGNLLTQVPDSALTLFTALISAFLISARLPRMARWMLRCVPRERLRAFLEGLCRVRKAVGGWLLAQVKLSGVSFALVLAGLLLLRLENAPFWALGICLVDAFPILGTGTVLLPWAALRFLQGDTPRAVGLLGIYVTVSVVRSVLEPRLLGKQLGLDPLLTLIALYAGFKLLGLPGMILAPLLTVTAIQLLPERR